MPYLLMGFLPFNLKSLRLLVAVEDTEGKGLCVVGFIMEIFFDNKLCPIVD